MTIQIDKDKKTQVTIKLNTQSEVATFYELIRHSIAHRMHTGAKNVLEVREQIIDTLDKEYYGDNLFP